MFSCLGKNATSCLRLSSSRNRDGHNDLILDDCRDDHLLWSKDLGRHAFGDFSFAVAQSNTILEDHSQVETGKGATFVGVYDGHGGDVTSNYVSEHLFGHINRLASEDGEISEELIRNAFAETENGFLALVRSKYETSPLIAATGSCCLVGIIWNRNLFVANLGDSRAVLGYSRRPNKIEAKQLTQDHNASLDEIRKELRDSHPEDPEIVVMGHGVWRVKDIIQVSRAIGDAFLKSPDFALGPEFPNIHLPTPINRAVLRADPRHPRILIPRYQATQK